MRRSILSLCLSIPVVASAAPLALDPEVVHAEVGASIYHADLAVTPDGTTHVLVTDFLSDELRYLNDATGGWPATPEIVSATSDVGPYNLLMALDPDGGVHAVFDPGPGDTFAHATLGATGTWSVEDLASGARWLRFGFDDEGTFYGAYSTGGLQLGTDASGSWVAETVRSFGGFAERDPVLVFEGPGLPAVAYVDRSDFSNPAVRLARKVEGVWTESTLDADGFGPLGVVRASDGSLDAVFVRQDEGGAQSWVHATDAGGGWSSTPVADLLSAGVADGSPLDLERVGDALVWADTSDGVRLFYGTAGSFRVFESGVEAQAVRLAVDGDRLLVLIVTSLEEVSLAELSLTDDDDDGVPAAFDTCPDLSDEGQEDEDADGLGDACDCGEDDLCTAWTAEGGFCDGSTPDRTDPDCDLCAIGPDADSDGVTDACDDCPDDPAKTAPGDCGCGEPEVDGCGDDEPADDGSCGCAQPGGSAAVGLGLLVLVAAAGRRRR